MAPSQPMTPPSQPDSKGAFGEGWVNAFDTTDSFSLFTKESKDEIIPIEKQQELLTNRSLGNLSANMLGNLNEVRGQGTIHDSQFKTFDPSSKSGLIFDQSEIMKKLSGDQPSGGLIEGMENEGLYKLDHEG